MPDNQTDINNINNINNIILQELRISQNKSDRLHEAVRETNNLFQDIAKDIPRLRDVETAISKLEEKNNHLEVHTNKHCGLLEGKDGLLMRITMLENKVDTLTATINTAKANSFSTPDRLLVIFGFILSTIVTYLIAKYTK